MASNKKNKEINNSNIVNIKPITDNQKLVFESWKKGKNQFLFGAAGTGKTFISLFLALREVLDLKKPYDKQPEIAAYQSPPAASEYKYQTFCGT